MNNSVPINYNPFTTDLSGIIDNAIKKAINRLQTCIPAIVQEVINRNTVIVTPAIQQVDTDWKVVDWANIKLPVLLPQAGGVYMSGNIKKGTTGWIIAGDLDNTLFFKDCTRPQKQNTLSRHDYGFGFFVPCRIEKLEETVDGDSFIIGTDNTRIVINDNKIDIKQGNNIITVKNGEVSITSSDTLKINAKTVNITGSSKVNINGTDWATHKHSVGTLTTTATVGSSSTVGTLSGKTGGVSS